MVRTLAFALFLGQPLSAAPSVRPDGSLNMDALHTAFKEGEVDQVKMDLESYLKDRGSKPSREDRIFAFKYLGVIYASDPAGRNRAESYFNRLFDLAPNIELAGMFVSKSIQDIFDEAKRDFLRNREYGSRFDSLGNPIGMPGTAAGPAAKDSADGQGAHPEELASAPSDSTAHAPVILVTTPTPSSPPSPALSAWRAQWIKWALGGSALAGSAAVAFLFLGDDGEGAAIKQEPVEIRVITTQDR